MYSNYNFLWFLDFSTGKDGVAKDYYTLECIIFLLKNVNLQHASYVKHAAVSYFLETYSKTCSKSTLVGYFIALKTKQFKNRLISCYVDFVMLDLSFDALRTTVINYKYACSIFYEFLYLHCEKLF